MDLNKLISTTPQVEVYVDLYGFSEGWIETIQNKLLALARSRTGDDAHAYTAWAAGGVAVRFTTDPEYAKTVEREARRLLNLAARTYRKLR